MKFIYIALGGAVGSVLRYLVSGFAYQYSDGVFPAGTLWVNLIGALFIGLLCAGFDEFIVSPNIKIFLLVGVLGGFTTFSTFALENFNLLRDGETKIALFNILISNIGALVLVFSGFVISRYLINIFK